MRVKLGNVSLPIYPQKKRVNGVLYESWLVAWFDGKKRQRSSFSDLERAKKFALAKCGEIAQGETIAARLTNSEAEEYGRAKAILDGLGITLADAARMAANSIRSTDSGTAAPVADCVAEMLLEKERDGLEQVTLRDYRIRLGAFAASFQMPLREVRAPMINKWLRALPHSAKTRNNYRKLLRALFRFAQRRGVLPADWDEIERVDIAKESLPPIEIYTPAELSRLFDAARPAAVPYLALGAFCGLRSGESLRLKWSALKWESGLVVIDCGGRTASRRLAPLTDAAKDALAPYRRADGLVCAAFYTHLIYALAKKSGIKWRHNALRHSFISYRLALRPDVSAVAAECGNTPAIIHRHYRELVTTQDAAEWFSVKRQEFSGSAPK